MAATNTILRYLKVRALADQGSEGEQRNAHRILDRMERENPDLLHDVARYQRGEDGEKSGNWEAIFDFMKTAAGTAVNFAETLAQAQYGRTIAEQVESSLKESRSGNVLITFKMSRIVWAQVRALNSVQEQVFRQDLHMLLDEILDAIFSD